MAIFQRPRTDSISSEQLNQYLQAQDAPTIVDARSPMEYRAGHIPGAINIPFWATVFRHGSLQSSSKSSPLVVTCTHGPRAKLAKFFFNLVGYDQILLLEGHMNGWKKTSFPMLKD